MTEGAHGYGTVHAKHLKAEPGLKWNEWQPHQIALAYLHDKSLYHDNPASHPTTEHFYLVSYAANIWELASYSPKILFL